MSINSLYRRDIISTKQLSLADVECVLNTAKAFKAGKYQNTLTNKIIAQCFFEPSTRTRLSFEAAALRLNGRILGFASDEATSMQKGETLFDSMRVISSYADLIVIRHPLEGAAALAAEAAHCPVINAGDGANQHPTQALLDLFTIQECYPNMRGLPIALVGDLKYGRTIHSFTELCSFFDVRLYLVSPEMLSLPDESCDLLKKRGIRFSFHRSLDEVIEKVDILYCTRIQQERFGAVEYQQVKDQFILNRASLAKAKSNLKILHPLPRVNEIASAVDETPHAYYFDQAANGIPIRQALLSLILNEALS